MNRRSALRSAMLLAAAVGGIRDRVFPRTMFLQGSASDNDVAGLLSTLRKEPRAESHVRTERGAPRLFVNGKEVFPLFGSSFGLLELAPSYRKAGLFLLHPCIPLAHCWPAPGAFDWHPFDDYLCKLLQKSPEAFFLPRIAIYPPSWWKETHPDQLVEYGLPVVKRDDGFVHDLEDRSLDSGQDCSQVSLASEIWRKDTEDFLRAWLRHVESSPLRSRLIGFQIAYGHGHEWHYFCAGNLPDFSEPMKSSLGPCPDVGARLRSSAGMFRDPVQESEVIDYYRRFHDLIAETLLWCMRIVKEETHNTMICGAFFGYLLENIWIQEGGHLATGKVLRDPAIDFLAGPYAYQRTNVPGVEYWRNDILDDGGNLLGRARGTGGDGGSRLMLESLRRHGKLYFVEMDPSTYLNQEPHHNGGEGSDTVEGSVRIIRRDLGRLFATGTGGWLFDHGPGLGRGAWFSGEPILREIREVVRLGALRSALDLSPVAEIAAVCDEQSFFVTKHWRADTDYPAGGRYCDPVNHWMLNSQSRALYRIGAPVDFLYRSDLERKDLERYKLLFFLNSFAMPDAEVERLRTLLSGSGVTVVWVYATAYVRPEGLNVEGIAGITGMNIRAIRGSGPLMTRTMKRADLDEMNFGVSKPVFPRFAVDDTNVETLGVWSDGTGVSLARKHQDGWHSIFSGAAPLPPDILRVFAHDAGATLWSSKPDVVCATRDTAMLVATSPGQRKTSFPRPYKDTDGGIPLNHHDLDLEFGDVRLFVAKNE